MWDGLYVNSRCSRCTEYDGGNVRDAMGDRRSLCRNGSRGKRGERVTLSLGCIALVCFGCAYCAYIYAD